jgi:hypothetical protein
MSGLDESLRCQYTAYCLRSEWLGLGNSLGVLTPFGLGMIMWLGLGVVWGGRPRGHGEDEYEDEEEEEDRNQDEDEDEDENEERGMRS